MAIFHGWGSTASRLESLWGGSLPFTISSQKLLLLIFYQPLKEEQHKSKIWPKEKSIGPYVAKMLFPQVDEGFWLPSYTTLVSDTKTSKVVLCFSLLLL